MTVQVFGRLPATATYVAALSAALLLLVLTVAAALWQTNQSVELNSAVRQSLEQRSSLRLLMRGMQDAETGQRGYLLTGDETYLEPYLAGREDIERELANQDRFAGSDTARLAEARRFRELVASKLDELQLTIDMRRNGRGNVALERVRSGRGKEVMDEFRAMIAAAEAREQAAVIDSMGAVDRSAARLRFVVVIAGLLLLGIAALMIVTVPVAEPVLRGVKLTFSFWLVPGAIAAFSLTLYPYVYLLARTAFAERGAELFEAARTLGLNRRQAWWRAALPVARPAIAGGALLVTMETLADFGTVSYYGVETLTTGIYRAWQNMGDLVAAAQLAALLLYPFVGHTPAGQVASTAISVRQAR